MSLAIPLRGDFDARTLRRLAKHSGDAAQTRRLLALAGIYDGTSRAKAAETGGVGTQIIRDWVERFNAKGPDGLINGKAPTADIERHASVGARQVDRERPDLGDPRGSALATDRSHAMDIRGIPCLDRHADAEPGTARHGLPQTLRAPAPSRASRGCHRGF